MSTPPPTPFANAQKALVSVRRYRADTMMAVAGGVLTPIDVIEAAAEVSGRHLLKIQLSQLLLAQPGVGALRVNAMVTELSRACSGGDDPKKLTVGWLLDNRTRGARFRSWLWIAETRGRPAPPWPGFPFIGAATGGSK